MNLPIVLIKVFEPVAAFTIAMIGCSDALIKLE